METSSTFGCPEAAGWWRSAPPGAGAGGIVRAQRAGAGGSEADAGAASEGRVVVLAGLEPLALGLQRGQGKGHLGPGLGGIDDGIHVPPAGGDIRIEQSIAVVGLEDGDLV